MKILVMGAGKMGSFFIDLLSFEHEVAVFERDPMRMRFTCGAREFCNKWSEAGPTHHMAAASGRHIDTILKVAKIFNVPVDVITR